MKYSKIVLLPVLLASTLSFAQGVYSNGVAYAKDESLLFNGSNRNWWYTIQPSPKPVELVNATPTDSEQEVIKRVEAFLPTSHNKAFVLMNGNKIVYSSIKLPATKNSFFMGYSMGKTVTSMAVGQAICQGKLTLKTKANEIIPELKDTDLGAATVRELLTMSAGTTDGDKTTSIMTPAQVSMWNSGSLNLLDLLVDPKVSSYKSGFFSKVKHGEDFYYKSTDPLVLGIMVSRSTGLTFSKFLQENIFNPAGIVSDGIFGQDRQGNPLSDTGVRLRIDDWARFALWVNQSSKSDGCFGDYVREAMSTQIENKSRKIGGSFAGYGYLIWTENTLARDTAWASGHGGQRISWHKNSDRMLIAFSNEETDALEIYSIARAWNRLK